MTSARAENLDARYGRTPGRPRRAIVIAVVVGAAVLATAIAWVVWVGLFTPTSSIDNQDVGYSHVDASTLTAAVKPLARRGLLTVETDPGDRRSRRLRITPEGVALMRQAVKVWRDTHAEVEATLKAGTVKALRTGLAAIG